MCTSSVARPGRKETAVRDVRAILLRAPIQTDTVLLGSTCDVNCRRGRDFGSVCIMKVYGRRGGLVTRPRAMIEVSQSLVDPYTSDIRRCWAGGIILAFESIHSWSPYSIWITVVCGLVAARSATPAWDHIG